MTELTVHPHYTLHETLQIRGYTDHVDVLQMFSKSSLSKILPPNFSLHAMVLVSNSTSQVLRLEGRCMWRCGSHPVVLELTAKSARIAITAVELEMFPRMIFQCATVTIETGEEGTTFMVTAEDSNLGGQHGRNVSCTVEGSSVDDVIFISASGILQISNASPPCSFGLQARSTSGWDSHDQWQCEWKVVGVAQVLSTSEIAVSEVSFIGVPLQSLTVVGSFGGVKFDESLSSVAEEIKSLFVHRVREHHPLVAFSMMAQKKKSLKLNWNYVGQ